MFYTIFWYLFLGYDNEEEVLLSALKSSKGYSSVNKQRLEALEYDDDTGQSEDVSFIFLWFVKWLSIYPK